MDSWLLAAGAIVLIAITLWIVWPARSTDASKENRDVEAPAPTMTESLPPQGDRFEDQYTSATADLSAAGVATALQGELADEREAASAQPASTPPSQRTSSTPPQTAQRSVELRGVPVQDAPEGANLARDAHWPEADPRTEPIGLAARAENYLQPQAFESHESRGLITPRTIGLGVGALLTLLGGAVLFARWRAERDKPINRLKRSQAGQVTVSVIEEIAEIVERVSKVAR